MPATPPLPLPLLKRVPPGVWMIAVWCAVTAYSLMVDAWPGEPRWAFVLDGTTLAAPRLPMLTVALVMVLCAGMPRRAPLPALALLLAGTVVSTVALSVKDIPLLQFLAVDIALCFLAATRPRRVSAAAAGMALGVLFGYALTRVLLGMPVVASTVVVVALTTTIAWLIGNSIHQGHVHADTLRSRAAEAAVTAERLRIARELHDMVAHSIGIIAIQAGMGSRVIDTQPVEARRSLAAIETTSRETLSGLRRMLGALRRADSAAMTDSARRARSPLDPAPGLADVERLAARTTAAGVRVDVRWRGERRALPPEIDLSAFRIIQESVTNVVRHADARSCQVSIDQQDAALSIEVSDDGRGSPAEGSGYGLVGMRERVALLHGDFQAAPHAGGGFRVTVRLPVPAGVR
ncbi:sensor histidine kinase [Streptomyces sp. N2-109]|uniref:Oxygen sensor histidine kinase NreB n=1 Tax=Streptomyces gossypii TaxID=2883101 RepID=A0ABT2JMB4_9ACTN|nr:sensor histidine kinase [Streptomyces gossypii]MCT2588664.1 sensor histidine kinase [Streptomyces gossypii]